MPIRAHPDVVADRHIVADDEVAAAPVGDQKRVVLHVGTRAECNARIAGIDDTSEKDTGVLRHLDASRQRRGRCDERGRMASDLRGA